jgi:hypothetical protein
MQPTLTHYFMPTKKQISFFVCKTNNCRERPEGDMDYNCNPFATSLEKNIKKRPTFDFVLAKQTANILLILKVDHVSSKERQQKAIFFLLLIAIIMRQLMAVTSRVLLWILSVREY